MSDKETKNKNSLEKQYFEEARSWDESTNDLLKKSNKRAWIVACAFGTVAVLEACAIITMMPLKTIEPFIIRVDNNTGYTDVVSKLAKTDGKTEDFLNENILEKLSADYTNNSYGRWGEAFSGNNGGQDIYITSTECKRTIVLLFPNSTIEEILETLREIDVSDFIRASLQELTVRFG